ncbi:hypothetical protein [Aestuariimicrobium ganziense]|nr:hypothetical protein [Aestuariimicrobium ganziense]
MTDPATLFPGRPAELHDAFVEAIEAEPGHRRSSSPAPPVG